MRAIPARPALYALLVCSLLSRSPYAADASGGDRAATIQKMQRQDASGITDDVKRDTTGRNAPTKAHQTADRGSNAGRPAARIAQPSVALHAVNRMAEQTRNALPGARAYALKPAVGAATRAYLIRRPDAAIAAFRANSPTTALAAARRPSAGVVGAANGAVSSLKAMAGNGVIGGASAAGRGMIGGSANTRSVINAGINGTTLRHRS
jgi:hypothetical protein